MGKPSNRKQKFLMGHRNTKNNIYSLPEKILENFQEPSFEEIKDVIIIRVCKKGNSYTTFPDGRKLIKFKNGVIVNICAI